MGKKSHKKPQRVSIEYELAVDAMAQLAANSWLIDIQLELGATVVQRQATPPLTLCISLSADGTPRRMLLDKSFLMLVEQRCYEMYDESVLSLTMMQQHGLVLDHVLPTIGLDDERDELALIIYADFISAK